jgi:Tfp pilus assembly protein PilX
MKISIQSARSPTTGKILPRSRLPKSQHGVVLVIALILLVVISLLAVTSIRNASSNASVSGNVRTTELASQAAEIALRHCERSVLEILTVAAGNPDPYVTGFTNILPEATPPNWQTMANWDSVSANVYPLPLNMVNQTGMVPTTYKRAPECMVERMTVATLTIRTPTVPAVPAVPAGPRNVPPAVPAVPAVPATFNTVVDQNSSYLITARGFGPEVVIDPTRGRPVGSEVWLQSQITIK